MEAISDTWDFSKPTGRTQDHDSAKLTITSRMPRLELAPLATFFCPAASLCGRTKASDHATQQRTSSTRAASLSMPSIICTSDLRFVSVKPLASTR